ncbi:hypothetical protein, conserved [Plasmodium gonderi]|uniref:C6H2-type domain-containing protein n=1 Tax=Plasmodium gonderi TaxID=77519 RepID=A0A1Y1JMZ2_PLAGO|nr:hypothetical protein, conserved [Plasmodium gonderi]GAW82908.1 hypothetical protein, conserved [Plasmodium gonderi]
MSICSGCGTETDATICCPICLQNNKKIFYCTQECFEKNYREHKKIHYFIKMTSSEQMQNRMLEQEERSKKGNLPVIILADENGGVNVGEIVERPTFSSDDISLNNGGNTNGNAGYDNYNYEISDTQMDSKEYKKNGKNSKFENFYRKKNNNKYKSISKNEHLFDEKSEQNENNNESYKGNYKRSKISTYMNKLSGYLFWNKYHMILPYYNDISVNLDKINSKNIKGKHKLSDKKILEIKKQLKMKKFVQLTILLVVISVIVILATCIFSYILETSQKNIQINSENLLNKHNTAKNLDMLEMKSYINVIEDLRKEIYEMKEVLYMHNVFLNKNFNLNTSYTLFNNFSKKKPSASTAHGKKTADKLGSLTSHLFYDNQPSSSDGVYNNGNVEEDRKNDSLDVNSILLTQHRYDINDIHEINNTIEGGITNEQGNKKTYELFSKDEEQTHQPQMRDVTETFRSNEVEYTENNLKESVIHTNGEMEIGQSKEHTDDRRHMIGNEKYFHIEKANEKSEDSFADENEIVQENVKNFIKNHNIPNNFEQATISNVIVNEEKFINSKNMISENKDTTTRDENMDVKKKLNENVINSHETQLKHKKYNSKVEDDLGGDSTERKFIGSKLNKKKQNTI